jgi:hypothetical protein
MQRGYYNDVLVDHGGTPVLFLLPRLTVAGNKFSKPTKNQYRDIEFLETLLIAKALARNENLSNTKETALLRKMIVPGVINSPRGRRPRAVSELRNALGS